MLKFTEEKNFTQDQVQQLFLSVGWVSGEYPQRLYKALMHSSTVLTVWDDEKLVGLARAHTMIMKKATHAGNIIAVRTIMDVQGTINRIIPNNKMPLYIAK